jgi:hypothetical protein
MCPHPLLYHPPHPSLSSPPPRYPAETILPLKDFLIICCKENFYGLIPHFGQMGIGSVSSLCPWLETVSCRGQGLCLLCSSYSLRVIQYDRPFQCFPKCVLWHGLQRWSLEKWWQKLNGLTLGEDGQCAKHFITKPALGALSRLVWPSISPNHLWLCVINLSKTQLSYVYDGGEKKSKVCNWKK